MTSRGRKNRIFIAGEERELPDTPNGVVTWKEDSFFDFERASRARFLDQGERILAPRRDKDKNLVTSLEQLREIMNLVVLHTDLVASARECARVLIEGGKSTHFMIDSDGTIFQGMDVVHQAYHSAGTNKYSIGIDLNSELTDFAAGTSRERSIWKAKYTNVMVNGEVQKRRLSRRKIINDVAHQAFGYTDAQYQALFALLEVLTRELTIQIQVPLDEGGELIMGMLEEPKAFEGIAAHWHLKASRWDPGPGFDWDRMLMALRGGRNSFPVLLPKQKNIAEIFTQDMFRDEVGRLYVNNEERSEGGTYPVGRFQNWHGGVHFFVPRGTPVRAMSGGVLVLAHFDQNPTAMGSNNFVVLKHEVEIPVAPDEDPRVFKFFSLYMHLGPIDFRSKDAPGWVKLLRAEYAEETVATESEEAETEVGRKNESVYLDFEKNDFKALTEGSVVLFPTKKKSGISIASGDIIANSGFLGAEDESTDLVHVELFTDSTWKKALIGGGHRRHFSFFSEDRSNSILVQSRELLSILTTENVVEVTNRPQIGPSDLQEFFSDPINLPARKLFRRAVTRHVSEWSSKIDWFEALVVDDEGKAPEKWKRSRTQLQKIFGGRRALNADSAFLDVLRKTLPFVWLTDEVADHLGIEQDPFNGVLYHFHPLYFLEWMTFYVGGSDQKVYRGVSSKELKARRKKELDDFVSGKANHEHFPEDRILDLRDLSERSSLGDTLEELRQLEVPGVWPLPDGSED